jgi:hypothetical protein
MQSRIWSIGILLAANYATASADDRLKGTWKPAEPFSGRLFSIRNETRWVFGDGNVQIKKMHSQECSTFTCKIDASKTPTRFQMTVLAGGEDHTFAYGIYKVAEERLRIRLFMPLVIASDKISKEKRLELERDAYPTSFDSQVDETVLELVFDRVHNDAPPANPNGDRSKASLHSGVGQDAPRRGASH